MKGTDVLGVLAHAGARSGARRFLFLIFFSFTGGMAFRYARGIFFILTFLDLFGCRGSQVVSVDGDIYWT